MNPSRRAVDPDPGELISIGLLARRTGVSPDTIRMWERRYGRPEPVRLPSGHRRYTPEHVRWLRRVTEAVAAGHRLALVVAADEPTLDAMLGRGEPASPDWEPERLLELARDYRAHELRAALHAACERLGERAFLESRLGPLMVRIGCAWADGEIDVRHEHFVTELVEDLLRTRRHACLPDDRRAPVVVLATLEGEQHQLGLQMAALLCSVHGVRACLLGRGAPPEQILRAVAETAACGVGIGVSLATAGVANDRALGELRRHLPGRVRLVVGGRGVRGMRRGPRGVDYCDGEDLAAFERWLGLIA